MTRERADRRITPSGRRGDPPRQRVAARCPTTSRHEVTTDRLAAYPRASCGTSAWLALPPPRQRRHRALKRRLGNQLQAGRDRKGNGTPTPSGERLIDARLAASLAGIRAAFARQEKRKPIRGKKAGLLNFTWSRTTHSAGACQFNNAPRNAGRSNSSATLSQLRSACSSAGGSGVSASSVSTKIVMSSPFTTPSSS